MDAAPHIAVVDDDKAIRRGLSSLLRSTGFHVTVFESAEAFLGSLSDVRPQCLLTDLQLPGMGGLDLQSRLRAEHPGIPVLVMTAFSDRVLRQKALAAGATCFLAKPFGDKELLDCIRRAVAGRDGLSV